jgi:hypothetical protein
MKKERCVMPRRPKQPTTTDGPTWTPREIDFLRSKTYPPPIQRPLPVPGKTPEVESDLPPIEEQAIMAGAYVMTPDGAGWVVSTHALPRVARVAFENGRIPVRKDRCDYVWEALTIIPPPEDGGDA